jgi:hypothetical protein
MGAKTIVIVVTFICLLLGIFAFNNPINSQVIQVPGGAPVITNSTGPVGPMGPRGYNGTNGSFINGTWINSPHANISDLYVNTYYGPSNQTGDYVIYTKSGITCARDTQTGVIISNANSSAIWNFVVNGHTTIIKSGNYTFTTKVLINQRHTHILADSNVRLIGSILPILEVDGNGMDGTINSILNDIQFTNLKFYYTGVVTTGKFIYIHELQNDKDYQGMELLKNICLASSQTTIPTDATFIGLYLENIVGVQIEYISITRFGTGIIFKNTIWQPSSNYLIEPMISYCKIGIDHACGDTEFQITNGKIIQCSQYGIYLESGYEAIIDGLQFEDGANAYQAIYSRDCYNTIIRGCLFSTLGTNTYAIKLGPYYESDTRKYATIENNHFYNLVTAIYTARPTIINSNKYLTVTNRVTIDTPGAQSRGWINGFDIGYNTTTKAEFLGIANASKTICSFTTVPGGFYEIGGYVNILTRTSGSIYFCVTFTDEKNVVHTNYAIGLQNSAPTYCGFVNSVTWDTVITTTIKAKAGTTITVSAQSTLVGTYDVGGFIRQVG